MPACQRARSCRGTVCTTPPTATTVWVEPLPGRFMPPHDDVHESLCEIIRAGRVTAVRSTELAGGTPAGRAAQPMHQAVCACARSVLRFICSGASPEIGRWEIWAQGGRDVWPVHGVPVQT